MKNYCKLFLLLLTCASCSKTNNTPNLPLVNQWQVLLTDNLSEWIIEDDFQAVVADNVLSLEANSEQHSDWLLTKNDYSNFELEAEFLSAAPSAIVVRYHVRPSTTADEAGYLVSLDHDPNQQNPAGTIVGVSRATVIEEVSNEEWTKLTIHAKGDHLKVFLNDQIVAESHNRKRIRGKIGLQVPEIPGKKVTFRNMRIKMLPEIEISEMLLEDRYRNSDNVNWEPLFKDSSLIGWDPIGEGQWEITDGIVHGYSGPGGGFLVSAEAYKNFYLKCDFKIIKEDNSGIFIRKSPDSTAVTITDAIECNIYDHNGPAHAYSTGSIATHARAWHGIIDYTDWNTMEIFAHEDHIVMYVNDRKSSEAHLPPQFNKAGNICLQGGIKVFSEDKGPSDIYFRNMMIKNMD